MKKLIGIFALSVVLVTASVSDATAQMYYSGKNVKFTFPRGIDSSKTYMFPTWKYQAPQGWDDTTVVTINDLETYVLADSLRGTTIVKLDVNSYVRPGAKLWLTLGTSAADTARTVYVQQGSIRVDTVSVTNTKIKRGPYVYNGNQFELFPK